MKNRNVVILAAMMWIVPVIGFSQSGLNFNKIRVASSASVNLIQGAVTSIVEEDEPGKDPSRYYEITQDGWLVINGNPSEDIIVTVDSLEKIEITGTGKLESEGNFNTGSIELQIVGVGKIELDLTAVAVNAIISGAGKIELDGTAEEMKIDISGSGKVDAENFKVKKATATISGSGKCLVNVTDELNSNISGSGSVYYTAPPAKITNNVTGVGMVTDINQAGKDTTRITLGKKNILIIDKDGKDMRFNFRDGFSSGDKIKSHWAGFELGINMLVDDKFKNETPIGYEYLEQKLEKSIAVHFNLVDYELKIYRRNILLVTGLGFAINNYRFTSDAYLLPDQKTVEAYDDPSYTLKKNKLVVSYVNVPLLLEFNTSQNPDKTVHVAVGMIGGMRIGSHVKMIRKSEGTETKSKIYDDFNIQPFRYDATIRFGYRGTTLFASYSLGEFFRSNKGPEMHPLTLGVRLVGW